LADASPLRIAMWSGPRNISTAMMRAWGNRPDTYVCDEPLYAYYLRQSGAPHPGAQEVIRHHETDWRRVVERLTGPIPDGKTIFFQKQMSHHLLPDVDRGWMDGLLNCFLIREPGAMLISLVHHVAHPALPDTGLPQQVEIFERVRASTGQVPPVIDADDVLNDPEAILRRLCGAVGIEFTPRMLSWPPGPRDTDGIWAKYWYKEVVTTSEFLPYSPKIAPVPERLCGLYDECLEYYHALYAHRLRVSTD